MRVQRSGPRGFTLIELLVVSSCMALLMTLAMCMLHAIAGWGSSTEASAHHAAGLHRLEESLRHELQAATKVDVAGNRLTIITPQVTSEWQLDGNGCLMTRRAAGDLRRERFETGRVDEWHVDNTNGVMTLSIDSADEPNREVLRIVERAPKLEGESP